MMSDHLKNFSCQNRKETMSHLSVCADTLFLELPFEDRVRRISEAGFMVEFWAWQGRNLDVILSHPDVRVGSIVGFTDGSIVHPDYLETYINSLEETLKVAQDLNCTHLILLAGVLGPNGEVIHQKAENPLTRWLTAYNALCRIAEIAERNNVVYCLEHLNTKLDHTGYCLPRVQDVVALVEAVNHPNIRILMDIYHAQIEEGNLIQLIRDYHPYIGYIHIADVPGRHEPGTGEINYPQVAQALREVGYEGTIGLEAYPQESSELAISRFYDVFK
jgi:hydroxypyruvate isomerase